jgi:hypothetical protein
MFTRNAQRGMAVAGTAALLMALTGCSLLGETPEPEDTSAANDAAAARFVACLTAEGQTAKILDDGMVGLLLPDAPGDGPGDQMTSQATQDGEAGGEGTPNMTAIMTDDEGTWQASSNAQGYPEDNGMRDAWLACEAEVPEFTQPVPDMSGGEGEFVSSEEQMEAALAFAECARDNGYADFPDPEDNGAMNLPTDITEDGFRQLLEDCMDPEKPMGLMIDKETADALDFDMMAVMQDFMEAHPEFDGPMSGGAQGAE